MLRTATAAALAAVSASATVVSFEDEPTAGMKVQAQKNPLKKVVTLLNEMKAQVEKEAEEDKSAYEKYECWCTSSEKEKTQAVADAEAKIAELTAFLEEAVAKEGQLKTEIEGLASDISEDQDALAQATGVREKENSAFTAEEADMKETLSALSQAIEVLSKVQLVQKDKEGSHKVIAEAQQTATALLQVKTLQKVVLARFPQYKEVMQKDLFDVLGALGGGDAKGASFLGKPNELEGAAAGAKSYNSRSGGIFGILSEMKDQFVRDLSNAQKEEFMALVEFQKLRAAKLAEIASAQEQKEAKEKALADLMAKAATAKEDLAATEEAKAADEKFLANLEETCTTEKNEYASRVKVRSEEIKAIGEAVGILTEDSARETFGKTLSFLQINTGSSAAASSRVAEQDRLTEKAMKRIAAVAKKHKNWSLASLAVRVRLDSFTKVKEMMDKMLEDLKVQQKEEYDKNEYCKQEIDKTEDEIKVATQQKEDLNEELTATKNTLETLATEIAQLQADVKANEVGLKQAGEARKEESQVFQETIADQRATIAILKKAQARLQEFYGAPGGSLAQVRQHRQEEGESVDPPPPKPKDYEKSGSAGGVMQMLQMVISDAESTEAQMQTAEQHAQTSYATLVTDTTASIEADRSSIALKLEEQAKAEGEKSQLEESLLSNGEELSTLESTLAARHGECDWLMKYFDVRQTARQEEMDSITDAKAILSGANFGK